MSAAKENKLTLWKMSPPGFLPKGECKVRKVLENTQAPRFQVFTQGCGDTTEGIDKEGGIDKEEQSILCLKSETGLHFTAMSTCSLSASNLRQSQQEKLGFLERILLCQYYTSCKNLAPGKMVCERRNESICNFTFPSMIL